MTLSERIRDSISYDRPMSFPIDEWADDVARLEEENEQQAQIIVDCQKKIAQLSCQLEDALLTNAALLDALYAFVNHVPELWGDEVQDGYIRLNISADAIHQIEAAIAKGE